ncbi:MAG TPA: hypothetical protein VH438_05775 [Gemmatimonadales bacterium]|jgi:hypothetical protein
MVSELLAVRAASNVAGAHGGHGTAPQSWFGWFVVAAAVTVVLLVLGLCARYFIEPGETSPGHIKRRILQ